MADLVEGHVHRQFQHRLQVDRRAPLVIGAREGLQPANDLPDAVRAFPRLAQHLLQVGDSRRAGFLREEVQIFDHHVEVCRQIGERGVDLVRDSRGQRPHRNHAVGENQLLLGPLLKLLRLSLFGDVACDRIDLAPLDERDGAPVEPAVRAVLAPVPVGEVGHGRSLTKALARGDGCFHVIRMNEVQPGVRHQLFFRPTEGPGPGRIEPLEGPVDPGGADHVGGHLQKPVALVLDLLPRRGGVGEDLLLGGLFLILDVGVDSDPAQKLSFLAANGRHAGEEPAKDSVVPLELELHLERRLRRQGVLPARDDALEHRRMVDRLPTPALHRLVSGSGVVVPAAIIEIDEAVGPGRPAQLRHDVEERAELRLPRRDQLIVQRPKLIIRLFEARELAIVRCHPYRVTDPPRARNSFS